MFVLYNALLRGFGFCGAVEAGIEFGSDDFFSPWKAKDINAWFKRSGHRFTNTIHALASAIKKLQAIADDAPATRLYRGLGGLSVREFLASLGFADKAFLSTTKDRDVALEYSGVKQGGVGTVLCIETSATTNGAVIVFFSQYPGEKETVWNACCYIQHLPGHVQVALPAGGGLVRVYHVLVSANSRALTVEELEARRKKVVTQVLDTLHTDVCRAADAAAASAEFKARASQDNESATGFGFGAGGFGAGVKDNNKDRFIRSIKDESAARVAVYTALPDSAYAAVETFGQAVMQGLALPQLAHSKLRLWLEDPSIASGLTWRKTGGTAPAFARPLANPKLAEALEKGKTQLTQQEWDAFGIQDLDMNHVIESKGSYFAPAALDLSAARNLRLPEAQALRLDQRRRLLQRTTIVHDSSNRIVLHDGLPRMVDGGKARAALALEDCLERRFVVGTGEEALNRKDDITGETPLIAQTKLGAAEAVLRLLQAGADADAATAGGETALRIAIKEGREDLVELLAGFHANLGQDAEGQTALHRAVAAGHPAVVQVLVRLGADVRAKDKVRGVLLCSLAGLAWLYVYVRMHVKIDR